MIRVLIGNLLDSEAQTLVNTVNCVGVMGKGIALEFKKRYPKMFEDYLARCKAGQVVLGHPYIYKPKSGKLIINFPTKDDWRSLTRLDSIEAGLRYLLEHYREWGIRSIAVPPLGCGNGQLDWKVVGPTLHRYLSAVDIPVELYAPYNTPHIELQVEFLAHQAGLFGSNQQKQADPNWVKPGWFAIVETINRITSQPYHYPVGRTIFQKISYILTLEGIPTELNFTKESYGPFSPELSRVATKLQNNGLIREEKVGNMHRVLEGPTYKDARPAYKEAIDAWEPILERVTDLFMRLDSSRAEIVASILFAAENLVGENADEADLVQAVMNWKLRHRPPLNQDQIAYHVRNLGALGWLEIKPTPDLAIPEYSPF